MATLIPSIENPFPKPPPLVDLSVPPLAQARATAVEAAVVTPIVVKTATSFSEIALKDLIMVVALIGFTALFSVAWIFFDKSQAQIPAVACLGLLLGGQPFNLPSTLKVV